MMRSLGHWKAVAAATVVALSMGVAGCAQKTKDLVDEAKMHLVAKDYQGALAKYDEALKADPESYDALWGKAQALGQHGQFAQEQALLEKILANAELAKKYGSNVKEALDRSYRTAATNLPKEAEGFLLKALKLDPGSAARSQLASVYQDQGDKASKAGNYGEAKANFEKILTLDVGKRRKREASNQADLAGFLDFKAKFQPDFDKARPDFEKSGNLDAASGRFVVEVTTAAVGSPKDKDFEANADKATLAAAQDAFAELVFKLAGQPRPDKNPLAFEDTDITADSKGWTKPNKVYRVKASAPVDALTFQIYRLRNPRVEAPEAEKRAPEAEKKAPEAEKK